MIQIKRDSGYADKLRDYEVELDGKIIGKIGDGQDKNFEVGVGTHNLRLRVDWARSNLLQFDMTENNTVRFRCANHLKGANVLLAATT